VLSVLRTLNHVALTLAVLKKSSVDSKGPIKGSEFENSLQYDVPLLACSSVGIVMSPLNIEMVDHTMA
jgi:hypothetical protein